MRKLELVRLLSTRVKALFDDAGQVALLLVGLVVLFGFDFDGRVRKVVVFQQAALSTRRGVAFLQTDLFFAQSAPLFGVAEGLLLLDFLRIGKLEGNDRV